MSFVATNSVDVTDAAVFIPEVWSLEILAAYKQNLVLAGLVTTLNHNGRKGDTIHIPKPTRGTAQQKAANTVVTVQAFTSTEEIITIDQHWEYSRLIEDITELQALTSLRPFFVNDAGYALSKRVDDSIASNAATWGGGTAYSAAVIGGDGTTAWDPAANTNAGNASALTDAGIRNVIQNFDDGDVPSRNRYMVVPPVVKNVITGTARFTEEAFVGERGMGNTIRNGLIGDLYGVEFYVSSNCPVVTDGGSATDQRAILFFQREAIVLATQMNIRVQKQYKLEYLSDLMVADILYGTRTVRGRIAGEIGQGCRALVVPA